MSNEYLDYKADTMCENALFFASIMHQGQKRKYTGEPYIEHPKAVARIINDYMTNFDDIPLFAFSPLDFARMKSAAYLHDVVEDTKATYNQIEKICDKETKQLVYYVTDESNPKDGNRKERKQKYLQKILESPYDAKCLKIADILSNLRTLAKVGKEYDKDFAIMYLKEKEEIAVNLIQLKERKRSDKKYYWYKIFARMLNDLIIELKDVRKKLESI